MLLWLADYLQQYMNAFGVFKYLSVRAILGVLIGLGISFLVRAVGDSAVELLTNWSVI